MRTKTIAFTWVYNDMVALELWCKYYSRYFDELLVLCCGTKIGYLPLLDEFKTKYNLRCEKLEKDDYDPGDAFRIVTLKQNELIKDYRWVLYSNCDEIVATDPGKYKDLGDFMRRFKQKWVWCVGYEVLRDDGENWLDYTQPILKQRKYWLKNPNMNKVLISRVPVEWNAGQHQIKETNALAIDKMANRGLYLVHLKHADYNAPNRDYVPTLRPMFNYVLENLKWKEPIPEWVGELI